MSKQSLVHLPMAASLPMTHLPDDGKHQSSHNLPTIIPWNRNVLYTNPMEREARLLLNQWSNGNMATCQFLTKDPGAYIVFVEQYFAAIGKYKPHTILSTTDDPLGNPFIQLHAQDS